MRSNSTLPSFLARVLTLGMVAVLVLLVTG